MATKKAPAVKKTTAPCALEARVNSIQVNQTHLASNLNAIDEEVQTLSAYNIYSSRFAISATILSVVSIIIAIYRH